MKFELLEMETSSSPSDSFEYANQISTYDLYSLANLIDDLLINEI